MINNSYKRVNMTKQEQALYDALVVTYNGNLRFLSQYDHVLFERINLLSNAIASGQYNERYFLEYIKENGDFDIFDSSTNTYLYDKKPKQWNNKAIVNTNFDTKNIISLINPKPYTDNITDISENSLNVLELNEFKVKVDITQYKHNANFNLDMQNKKPKSFNKFLFIGTLLGRHIPKILAKINSRDHFVCEANLEIFRLSLFVCDYSLLARNGKSVVFSIMDDSSTLSQKFNIFFQNDVTRNTLYKYYSTNYNVDDYFNFIVSATLERDPFIFNYRAIQKNIVDKTISNIQKYKTINLTLANGNKFFLNKPVLFLGAGPSLGKNIAWVKANQDKFIIVAMGATLKRLYAHNIKPDIVTTLDPQDNVVLHQFQVPQVLYNDSIKIASANTHEKVFEKLSQEKENLFIFETLRSFFKDGIGLTGLSIGEVTFKMLLLLNVRELYLLGIDLAVDDKTGKSHDSSHHSKNQFKVDEESLKNNALSNKQNFSLREDIIRVKGNFKAQVPTTRLFYASLTEYNNAVREIKKPYQTIYNLSQDGAYIDESQFVDILDINLQNYVNKEQYLDELLAFINKLSLEFKKETYTHLNDEIAKCDVLIDLIVSIENTNYDKFELFEKQAGDFFYNSVRLFNGGNVLCEIILNYYFIVLGYIQYNLNDRNIKNDNKILKSVQYLWANQLKNIINEYKQRISELIK